jgi:monofunctional chorismate mutase
MASANPDPGGIAAVRGAVPVPANRAEDILAATARLLTALLDTNGLAREQVVSALFTATDDLDADFPAHAARRLGWSDVPLLNAREIPVPGAMPSVVRVLLTVAGVPPGTRLAPVYLDQAAALRPDLAPRAPQPAPRATHRVAILGLGQIGGSIARALGRSPAWVRAGYDLDPAVTRAALAVRAIDRAAQSIASACADAELAVIATPVDTLPALIAAAAAALPAGAALVDTGSARGTVTAALAAAAARGLQAVGGHPLAGSEGRGFAASRADLFAGATFTLSPVAGPIPEIVVRMVQGLGARPLEVDPEAHDHALARTSHLPYLIACALRDTGREAHEQGLSGPGFRDMTRLAASDPRIANAYCHANAREVTAAWQAMRSAMDRTVAALGEPEDRP